RSRERSCEKRRRVDQLGGPGKYVDGASRGERGLRGGRAASEVAGTTPGGDRAKRRKGRYGEGVARISGSDVCQVAIAGRIRVLGCDTPHQRRQIQKNCAARTVRGLEVGELVVGVALACDLAAGGRLALTVALFPLGAHLLRCWP